MVLDRRFSPSLPHLPSLHILTSTSRTEIPPAIIAVVWWLSGVCRWKLVGESS